MRNKDDSKAYEESSFVLPQEEKRPKAIFQCIYAKIFMKRSWITGSLC